MKTRKPRRRRQIRYTARVGQEICFRLAAGQPLVDICHHRRMPDRRTVSRWRRTIAGFDAAFLLARDGEPVPPPPDTPPRTPRQRLLALWKSLMLKY